MKQLLILIVSYVSLFPMALALGEAEGGILQLSKVFDENERKDHSSFTYEQMSRLGSEALFQAKILEIKSDSLKIEGNTSYFQLKNGKDICRQIFINELLFIVHTKCYRGSDILLNYLSRFQKNRR